MLFETLFESLAHRHNIPQSLAEDEGDVIKSRRQELLDLTEIEQQDKCSTGHRPDGKEDR